MSCPLKLLNKTHTHRWLQVYDSCHYMGIKSASTTLFPYLKFNVWINEEESDIKEDLEDDVTIKKKFPINRSVQFVLIKKKVIDRRIVIQNDLMNVCGERWSHLNRLFDNRIENRLMGKQTNKLTTKREKRANTNIYF